MTKDDVTRLAHEAGGFDGTTSLERPIVLYAAMSKDFLDKFADLVAKQEREACAKLCLEGTDMPVQVDAIKIIRAERERISNAIRARGIDVAKVGEVGVWGDKREWVGLTDEEIYDYADKFLYQHGSNFGIKSFGKAIEAKLKEKNT